ncbi:MAG: IS4 family transposase [Gammaproteobacteria bacterium]|nr:IS4 family transposase [Gammaproteobacteria bacterium]
MQQPREEYIGWSQSERKTLIQRIAGMARFLIRPQVRCANLASKSLGLLSRRVVSDYHLKHGIRPVLIETCVSPEYSGISYRACGWEKIGETHGRDRSGRPVPKKAIYVKPLVPAWRAELGICRVKPLNAWEGIDSKHWAEQEFAGARPGDARRVKRLIRIAEVLTAMPSNPFFAAARGEKTMISGYCRLIEHPDEEAVNAQTILAGHRERTRQRMQAQQAALIIQDGSDLNFATRQGCEGLGRTGRNSEGTLGLHLHSTCVVSGEGLPLGVAALQIDRGHQEEQPKTLRWIEGLKDSAELSRDLERVTLIAAMDREGDDIRVLDVHRRLKQDLALLVRAKHDRRIAGGSLFEQMRSQPVRHRMSVRVPKLSGRRATGTRKAVFGREARDADCELRWMEVTIPIPEKRKAEAGDQPVVLNAVHVRESEEPDGDAERLEWFLYASLPVSNAQQALDVIQYYRLRWRIEDWHRILKSGCGVELLAHRTAARLKRAIALRAVAAWRLATLTLLGRETPGLDPSVLFSEVELAVIRDFARFRSQKLPENLGQAVNVLAMMGGCLNRPHDAPTSSQVMWEGYSYLYGNAQVIERARALGIGSEVSRMIAE